MQRRDLIGLAGLLVVIYGCGNSTSGSGIFNQPSARIRTINAMDGTPTASWEVTNQNGVSFPGVAYGTESNTPTNPYVILNEQGTQTVEFFTPSSPTTPVASAPVGLAFTNKITAVAYGTPPTGNIVLLYDQTANNSIGAPNVRFVNAAATTGPVDVFIFPTTQSQTIGFASNLSVGSVAPTQATAGTFTYTTLSGGAATYTVNVFPAGHDTGAPIVSAQETFASSDNWTLYLIDPVTSGNPPTILALQDNNPNAG